MLYIQAVIFIVERAIREKTHPSRLPTGFWQVITLWMSVFTVSFISAPQLRAQHWRTKLRESCLGAIEITVKEGALILTRRGSDCSCSLPTRDVSVHHKNVDNYTGECSRCFHSEVFTCIQILVEMWWGKHGLNEIYNYQVIISNLYATNTFRCDWITRKKQQNPL